MILYLDTSALVKKYFGNVQKCVPGDNLTELISILK